MSDADVVVDDTAFCCAKLAPSLNCSSALRSTFCGVAAGSPTSPNNLVDAGPFSDDDCSRATFSVTWPQAFGNCFTKRLLPIEDPPLADCLLSERDLSRGPMLLGNALPVDPDRHSASSLTATILQPGARTNDLGRS
jgi:hypothetical protein